jgi:hypothetical protein
MCKRFVICLWLGDRSSVDGDPLADEGGEGLGGAGLQAAFEGGGAVQAVLGNLVRAALDSFYTQLGLGRPVVPLEEPIKAISRVKR